METVRLAETHEEGFDHLVELSLQERNMGNIILLYSDPINEGIPLID